MILSPEEIEENKRNPRPEWNPKKEILDELSDLENMAYSYITDKTNREKAINICKKLRKFIQ